MALCEVIIMLKYVYHTHPTPHIYFPQLLPPELYERVEFPTAIPVRSAGRSGRDLFVGEPGFAEAVGSGGLKELYQTFSSSEFVQWVLSIFEKDLIRLDCQVRAKDAKLVDYLETREALDKWPEELPGPYDINEVFNRFDFTIGESNYTEYVHLDSSRRIVGGVLFFSDAKKEAIEGGEFTLYRDLLFNNDREPHWPVAAKKFPVKENTGVLFLNCNKGFHGPARIRSMRGNRRWIYYSISSRGPVWQRGKESVISATALSLASRLGMEWRMRKPYRPQSMVDADRHDS